MPNKASHNPTEGDCRPSPPVKENRVGDVLGDVGALRKMGKMCMNAELWRGSRPKDTRVTRTSRVQILRNGGFGRGLGSVTITVSSECVGGNSSSLMAVYSVEPRCEPLR